MADGAGRDGAPLRQGFAPAGPEDGTRDAGRSGAAKNRVTGIEKGNLTARAGGHCRLSLIHPRAQGTGTAFCRPFALSEFKFDQWKEDAACRFSFAITMSIKPSRR